MGTSRPVYSSAATSSSGSPPVSGSGSLTDGEGDGVGDTLTLGEGLGEGDSAAIAVPAPAPASTSDRAREVVLIRARLMKVFRPIGGEAGFWPRSRRYPVRGTETTNYPTCPVKSPGVLRQPNRRETAQAASSSETA
ncbi:hypothetical protein GCM10010413_28370 [Promicromonospora sukumoe]